MKNFCSAKDTIKEWEDKPLVSQIYKDLLKLNKKNKKLNLKIDKRHE